MICTAQTSHRSCATCGTEAGDLHQAARLSSNLALKSSRSARAALRAAGFSKPSATYEAVSRSSRASNFSFSVSGVFQFIFYFSSSASSLFAIPKRQRANKKPIAVSRWVPQLKLCSVQFGIGHRVLPAIWRQTERQQEHWALKPVPPGMALRWIFPSIGRVNNGMGVGCQWRFSEGVIKLGELFLALTLALALNRGCLAIWGVAKW